MKVEVNEKEKTVEIEYPRLMKTTHRGNLIVLFTGKSDGIVVCPHPEYELFEFKKDWWDMDCFEPFYGTITLINE